MQDAPLVIEALCPLDRSVVWEAVRGSLRARVSFVDEVSETVQLARTSRRFFDPPDRDQGRRGRRRRTGTRGMASDSSREPSFSTVCVSG